MNVYLDTNILIADFDPKDRYHGEIAPLLQRAEVHYFLSPITLVEFECKVARMWSTKAIKLQKELLTAIENLTVSNQIKTIVEFLLSSIPIQIISLTTLEVLAFNKKNYIMEDTLVNAYKIGAELQLRAMDVLQLSSALKIRIYGGIDLQYFLTNDQNILEKTNQIYQKIHILPISSQELVKILKI